MTQSPYVPSGGGQDQDPQSGEWSTTGSSGFASSQPDFDPAAPYGQFDEPASGSGSTAADQDLYGTASTGGSGTTDTAKSEAADLKNTAADRGQQVAGVAKEQASAVKDNALDKGQQVAGVAKEQATAVKDTALDKGQQVADVAKDEVGKVTAEATGQFKDLLQQGRTELSSQASSQQQRLGSLVHSFADELGTMASSSKNAGPLTDLAKQGSRRIGELAHYIETSEPTEVLDTVRTFARRRPAAFLIGSALAGVVVGRLSRSLAAGAKDAKADQAPALTGSGYATSAPATGYDTGAYTTGGYESGSYGTATTDTGYTTGTSYAGTETGTYDDTVTYADPDRGGITR